eukprot:6597507-Karenia_brevis.AAC.1
MSGMQRVVADMEASHIVSPDIISAAKSQMDQLFTSLTSLTQQVGQPNGGAASHAGGMQQTGPCALPLSQLIAPQQQHAMVMPLQHYQPSMGNPMLIGQTQPVTVGMMPSHGASPSHMA